ncbi:hypothetical protein Sjap_018471 [Stephania japonica]|uniref:Pathogen-related protein n=1 Tax=Stephania japonica TaxID=461633 RepID=A0AAP0NN80_9MAGN
MAEVGDKYRSYITGEGEKNTVWRFGAPPNYDVVNKLFEDGRTHVWSEDSEEGKVQRLVKSWEMELVHKVRPQDYKSVNAEKFRFSVNGRPELTLDHLQKVGGYNAFLATSMPENLRGYNPEEETSESANKKFVATFPRGFALEILQVYSGPPVIAYKFRHWSFMEGPFNGHAPTGELAQFFGIGIFTLDENMKVEKVEFFYDGGELIGELLKGPALDGSDVPATSSTPGACPFFKA